MPLPMMQTLLGLSLHLMVTKKTVYIHFFITFTSAVQLDYANRVNNEFIKSSSRGITHLFSSGDDGVGGSTLRCTSFVPTFPGASPYVTSVGATQTPSSNTESAVSFSQGGFSNYWSRPSWQDAAVKAYFSTYADSSKLPASSYYNAAGRGFPDVAGFIIFILFLSLPTIAHGVNYEVVLNGITRGESGTSASCPTFAGIVALLNDARLNQGKTTLGFLNPLLYTAATQTPNVFNDITSGNNPGCGTNGFYAAQKWDPVTGLGTPNFPNLKSYVTSLP